MFEEVHDSFRWSVCASVFVIYIRYTYMKTFVGKKIGGKEEKIQRISISFGADVTASRLQEESKIKSNETSVRRDVSFFILKLTRFD